MKESNIILTPITQANGQIKNRPTVILREMPKFRDFLVCGVSTQLKQNVPNFDEIIYPWNSGHSQALPFKGSVPNDSSDSDFVSSGLISESVIRLGFLAIVPRSKIIGVIGSISPERHKRLLQNLSNYLISQLII